MEEFSNLIGADLLQTGLTSISVDGNEANFVIPHYVHLLLKADCSVLFLHLEHSLNHYSNILAKMGLNVKQFQEQGSFIPISGFQFFGHDLDEEYHLHKLRSLYEMICEHLEKLSSARSSGQCALVVDNVSILPILGFSVKETCIFLQYVLALSRDHGPCVLKIYVTSIDNELQTLWSWLQCRSAVSIECKRLTTGYCKDVHGEIEIHRKSQPPNTRKYQFQLTDKSVKVFAIGTSSAVL